VMRYLSKASVRHDVDECLLIYIRAVAFNCEPPAAELAFGMLQYLLNYHLSKRSQLYRKLYSSM